MSYTMDFENGGKITKEDTIMEYEGFRLVSDAMSLLYLFGKPCRSYIKFCQMVRRSFLLLIRSSNKSFPCLVSWQLREL